MAAFAGPLVVAFRRRASAVSQPSAPPASAAPDDDVPSRRVAPADDLGPTAGCPGAHWLTACSPCVPIARDALPTRGGCAAYRAAAHQGRPWRTAPPVGTRGFPPSPCNAKSITARWPLQTWGAGYAGRIRGAPRRRFSAPGSRAFAIFGTVGSRPRPTTTPSPAGVLVFSIFNSRTARPGCHCLAAPSRCALRVSCTPPARRGASRAAQSVRQGSLW